MVPLIHQSSSENAIQDVFILNGRRSDRIDTCKNPDTAAAVQRNTECLLGNSQFVGRNTTLLPPIQSAPVLTSTPSVLGTYATTRYDNPTLPVRREHGGKSWPKPYTTPSKEVSQRRRTTGRTRANAMMIDEILQRYGVENLTASSMNSIPELPHLTILRCPQDLPPTDYIEGISKAFTHRGESFLAAAFYPSLPSLNDTVGENYESIQDHKDIAFPTAKFSQKMTIVVKVRLCMKPLRVCFLTRVLQLKGLGDWTRRQVHVLSMKSSRPIQPSKGLLFRRVAKEVESFLASTFSLSIPKICRITPTSSDSRMIVVPAIIHILWISSASLPL